MGTNGRPSINKRLKEQNRQERQRDKAARRQQRKVDRQNGVVAPAEETAGEASAPHEAPVDTPGASGP